METELEQAVFKVIEPYMCGKFDKISARLVKELAARAQEFSKLDHDFAEIVKDIAGMDETESYNREQYNDIIGDMQNSVVIYFKSAGLFRVYNPEEFMKNFECRLRTYYRRKEVYEVINDESPQKIIVIIDSRDSAELNKIKQHIINYMRTLQEFTEDELVIYDNTISKTYEIIINKVVDNALERETFVSKLLKYIEKQEKNADLSSKMNKRRVSEIDGATTYLVPDEELKKRIAGIAQCYGGMVTPLNVTIVQNNITNYNGPTHIGDNNYFNEKPEDPADDPVNEFIKYLELTKPEWYVPGGTVLYDDIYEEFCDVTGSCSKQKFTRLCKGLVFNKSFRLQEGGKRQLWVKLLM